MLEHVPVLLNESAEFICSDLKEGTILDCTCGAGGHSAAFLHRTNNDVNLICIDRDKDAIDIAKKNLREYVGRVDFMNIRFSEIEDLLEERNVSRVFYDLGISTMQIDRFEKGFTYKKEQNLDMRMGKSDVTAYTVVNEYTLDELVKIFRVYGQERFSKRIAENIVDNRGANPIKTTTELALIVRKSVPRSMALKSLSRIFQSIRIVVNDELAELESSLRISLDRLTTGGKIAIITYHSLERNIVRGVTTAMGNVRVRKKNSSRDEIKGNRRARSAKLYKIEKL